MLDTAALQALRKTDLVAELDEAQCQALAALMEHRTLADGEVLVAEGRPDRHVYLLLSGQAQVLRDRGTPSETLVTLLGAGDTIGELSFLDDHVHRSTIAARGPATALALSRDALESLLDQQPRVVYGVLRAIVRRVHGLQQRLATQAVELSNYVYKQHGRY